MERVTGLGGCFIKAKNPKELADWYEKHLGIPFGGQPFTSFPWINKNHETLPGQSVFSFFKQESDYFKPSSSSFMINFRVKDLAALLTLLKQEGVELSGEMMDTEYGKFAWILDPEGNKVELWEPKESDGIC